MATRSKKINLKPNSNSVHPLPEGLSDAIHHGDCVAGLKSLPEGCAQLAFADPPFNIGYDYDVYDDRLDSEKYLDWSRQWISEIYRVLVPTGTFWLAIGDEYAAELKLLSQNVGFHCRSWVIWYYTFGVHCHSKFTRSHAHLFHFVKDSTEFLFNAEDIAVPSARQLVYADSRANPKGRTPDDTWILRPQDCRDGLQPNEDTWYFPRVNGTFKERAGFHGCQMPEQLLGRVIRSSSRPGDLVVDPFSGSATTLAVAKKLGRHFLGFDLSEDYVALGTERLRRIEVGQPLDGSPEPKASAPDTSSGRSLHDLENRKGRSGTTRKPSKASSQAPSLPRLDLSPSLEEQILEVMEETRRGASVTRLIVDPILNGDFQRWCDERGIPGTPATRNQSLLRLKAHGRMLQLSRSGEHAMKMSEAEWDRYAFASEIAWKKTWDLYGGSLDELFSDPRTASVFDHFASQLAPGHLPLEYRWTALLLRDQFDASAQRMQETSDSVVGTAMKSCSTILLSDKAIEDIPALPCVYAIEDAEKEQAIFVGETLNLRSRIAIQCHRDRLATHLELPFSKCRVRFEALPRDLPLNFLQRTRWLSAFPTSMNVPINT